jgi:hypothetical protein
MRLPDFFRNIFPLADDPLFLSPRLKRNFQIFAERFQRALVFGVNPPFLRFYGHRPIHSPRIEIKEPQSLGQNFTDRAFSRSRRSIDGYDFKTQILDRPTPKSSGLLSGNLFISSS